ncbi:MAG TPA: HTTM domain-containing protein [Polyangiales bacterium]|nr:HTTM domain-containing protein [Polyangiales bacterium]
MRFDKSLLREAFLTVDIRTLGLARIYIALLLLFDLAKRSAEMSVWYFETGLLPNAMLAEHPLRRWGYSFLFHVSSDMGVRLAFVLIALVYLCFLLGLFTRLAHLLSLVCLISLQIRIDVVSNGGDFVFCNLMVWTAFLPLGAAFSVDAWRQKKGGKLRTSPVVSWAMLVVLLQLAVIYYFNAVHKNGETWLDGSAVYWLAHQERIVTAPGYWMREHLPFWAFQAMTYTSLVIEYALPWLILSPWGRPWTRRAAIAGIWVLHLGIAMVANVGLFSFVMIGYSMLLFSREDWEWLRSKLAKRRGENDPVTAALSLPPVDGPDAPRSPLRWVGLAALGYLLVVATSQVLVENSAVPRFLRHAQPRWIQATVATLRLNQGWSMFARDAPRDDMWLVFDALTEDGRHIDPVNQVASRYADPTLRVIPPRLGQNYYWCDYIARIQGFRRYHRGLSDWIFRHHERTGDEQDRIVLFRAYEITQRPPAPGQDGPQDVKSRLVLAKRR